MNVHRLVGAEIHAERLVVPASATTVCATFEWCEGQSCESENMFHTKCMTKINKSWFCDACVAAGAVACVGSDEDGFEGSTKDNASLGSDGLLTVNSWPSFEQTRVGLLTVISSLPFYFYGICRCAVVSAEIGFHPNDGSSAISVCVHPNEGSSAISVGFLQKAGIQKSRGASVPLCF